jgi:hypothetical protein
MKRLLFYLLVFQLILNGCAKPQPKVSWLFIDEWTLEANLFSENPTGELTHNFTEAFVNINGKFIGAFQVPIKIPVLQSGPSEIVILPGVRNNGVNDTKKRYPFVEPFVTTINLELEETVSIAPITRYYKQAKFLIEDFENPAIQLMTDPNSVATLVPDNNPTILKWGNFYGSITLTDTDSLFLGVTNFGVNLPKQGADVYLEFDYMNSEHIYTRVLSLSPNSIDEDISWRVNRQDNPEWRKIYIDLKEIVSFRMNATLNEHVFLGFLEEKGTTKFIYLDNIKVVYY